MSDSIARLIELAALGTRDSARMIASLNAGTSSGLRDVIRLPSSTTGLST